VIEIRSYRRVFDLERRVYSVDSLRLNPGGIPVRGVVYLIASLLLVLLVSALPLLGSLARLLPWYLRDLGLPAGAATLLSVIAIEGRSFHLAAVAVVRYRLGPRRLTGSYRRVKLRRERWIGEVLLIPDGSDSRMRRLRYTGPGAVLIAREHRLGARAAERSVSGGADRRGRADVVVHEAAGAQPLARGEVLSLRAGATLLIRPQQRSRH